MRTFQSLIKYLIPVVAMAAFACGDKKTFVYGQGDVHPGAGKPLGGELYFAQVVAAEGELGLGPRGWSYFWFRNAGMATLMTPEGRASLETAPNFAPNSCYDITAPIAPPFPKPADTTFVDFGAEITLTPASGTAADAVVLPRHMPGVDDHGHAVDIGYGGNGATFPLDKFKTGTFWNIAGADTMTPSRFYMPKGFTAMDPPLGVAKSIDITKNQPLTLTWQSDEAEDAEEHSAERAFAGILIGGAMGKYFFCPLNDGKVHTSFTIPAEVISQMDPTGFIEIFQPTHTMALYKDMRVDLFALACIESEYVLK